MHDNDPANTLPGSGNLSALDATSPDYGHPAQEKIEKPRLPKHILVVEDDASLADLEADVLAASGYTVTIASSGELAVVAFQQAIPDLIVLDLELAGTMTGWDVLRKDYNEQERLIALAEHRRFEFIRWLVDTGKLTDQIA